MGRAERVLAVALLLVLALPFEAAGNGTGEPPLRQYGYQRGEFQFTYNGKSYVIHELQNSSLKVFAKGQVLTLTYRAEEFRPGTKILQKLLKAELHLLNVSGPGKLVFDPKTNGDIHIELHEIVNGKWSEVFWGVEPFDTHCAFVFSSLGPAGVNGTVSCTGLHDYPHRKDLPPIKATFTALP